MYTYLNTLCAPEPLGEVAVVASGVRCTGHVLGRAGRLGHVVHGVTWRPSRPLPQAFGLWREVRVEERACVAHLGEE